MLTVAAAAVALGLKEPTIRLWIAQRKLAHVKLGRAVHVPETEISRLILANTIPATQGKRRA